MIFIPAFWPAACAPRGQQDRAVTGEAEAEGLGYAVHGIGRVHA